MVQEVTRAEFDEYCHKVDGIQTFINVLGGEALLRKEATWQKTLEEQGKMMQRILEELAKHPSREEIDRRFKQVENRLDSMDGSIQSIHADIKGMYSLLKQLAPGG